MVDECASGSPRKAIRAAANRHRHSTRPSREQLQRENERLLRENEELRRKVAEREKQIAEREKQITDAEKTDRGSGTATGAAPAELHQLLQTTFLRRVGGRATIAQPPA